MRHIMKFAALLSLLLSALPAGAAPAVPTAPAVPAASAVSDDLQYLVGQAQVVFAGTVSGSVCARLREGMITETTFHQLAYVKGKGPVDSLTIRRRGGDLASTKVGAEGPPDFCFGERCVLFVSGGLGAPFDSSSRFVGPLAAVFRIYAESPKQKPTVHSVNGTPVEAVRAGRVLYAADETSKTRVTEKEFLDAIRTATRKESEPATKR